MNLLRANRPTRASTTLLLAVAPPAHNKLRKLYDETLTFHVLRLNDNVPAVPHRRNAAYFDIVQIQNSLSAGSLINVKFSIQTALLHTFQNFIKLISNGT